MDNQKSNDQQRHSTDFLLAEYQRLIDSFWRTEELGERRVSFFITLTAAVITAFAAIKEIGIGVSILGLGALFLFGLSTLVRIIHRNLKSHEYLRATGRVRAYFKKMDPDTEEYMYKGPYDDKPQRKQDKIFSWGTGGLVETVALVNSIIVAVLTALVILGLFGMFPFNQTWLVQVAISILFGILVSIAAWILQIRYVRNRYDEKRPKDHEFRFPSPKGD